MMPSLPDRPTRLHHFALHRPVHRFLHHAPPFWMVRDEENCPKRSHICIHIDSYSNFPYWIHLRTWIAQTLLYTTWQTTESCLSGCGRSLNLLHHFCELWLHRYANFELEALDCFEPKLRSFWTRIKRLASRLVERGKMSNINQKSNKQTQPYKFCSGNSAATSDATHNQTTTPLGWNRLLIQCLDPASLPCSVSVGHATSLHHTKRTSNI